MCDDIETQLDQLLTEGSEGEVEAVPLLRDFLGLKLDLQMLKPSRDIVHPERWKGNLAIRDRHL